MRPKALAIGNYRNKVPYVQPGVTHELRIKNSPARCQILPQTKENNR